MGAIRRGRSTRAAILLRGTTLSGLSALAIAGAVPAQAQSATIPLYPGSDSYGFANQIIVAVGGGSDVSVLMDTGSTGLYLYESLIGPDSTTILSGGAPITFQYGYSSGNELHGYFVSTPVAFPGASTSLVTGAITVGAVTELVCKGGGDDCPGWPTGQGGVMGVAYSAEPAGVFNPLAQLGGTYGNGFIVVSNDLGDPGVTPHVVVGLTAENTAGFTWASFAADTGGTQPAGLNAWNTKSINTCFSVNSGSPGCYITVFDTGAQLGSFETGTSGDSYGGVTPGSVVNTTVPGVISFTTVAGTTLNENAYVYDPAHGGTAGYNSGAQVFRYYIVAYDAVNGRIGFAPLQNVLLGTIYADSDADLGVPGGGVLLDGMLVLGQGFSSDRSIAFGSGAGLTVTGHAALDGTLSGNANLNVGLASGSALSLGGVSTYSGILSATGGTLIVNGVLPASLLLDGTQLKGSGILGGLAAASGSTVAPGNSIGTLGVLGNVVLAPGSTYRAEIGAGSSSDRIAAGGTVYLGGTLDVAPYGEPTPVSGSRYTLVTAQGGVNGTFQSMQAADFGAEGTSFPFLSAGLIYQPNAVELVMSRSAVSFTVAARTPNQFAMATAADSAPDNDAVIALTGLSAGAAAPALQALSGEIYASAQSVMQQQSVYLRDAVGARLRQALMTEQREGRNAAAALGPTTAEAGDLALAFWMQGFGGWGDTSSNGNAVSVSNSIGGAMFGVDSEVAPGWRAGLVGGYSRSSFSASGASGDMDNYDVGLYAGTRQGPVSLSLGAAYGWHDIAIDRSIVFAGYGSAASGDYEAGTFQAFGELAYDVALGGTTITPFAGLAYVGVEGAGLRETGGSAALDVATEAMDTTYSALGIRFGVPLSTTAGSFWLGATLGWQHAFGDIDPAAISAFATGSTEVALGGVPIAENAALLGVEVALSTSDRSRLAFRYAGQLASDASQSTVLAQWVVKF